MTTMSFSDEIPFQINVPDEKLSILHAKLELATFPDELEGAGWKYGAPLADIKRLAEKWRSGYDWRKDKNELNQELPMFTRDIEMEGFGTLNIQCSQEERSCGRHSAFVLPWMYVMCNTY